MKRRLIYAAVITALVFAAITALVFVGAAAFAAEAPVKQDPAAATNPNKFTINDCLLILAGLNAVDEHIVIVNQGKPTEAIVKQSYEYGNGRFRSDLSRNIVTLTTIQQSAQQAQQRVESEIKQKYPGDVDKDGQIRTGSPAATEYDKRLREVTGEPCSAELVRIKDSELLKVERNELPASALANLDKIRDKDK